MDLSDTHFTAHNFASEFEQPEDISEYLSIAAPPNSSIWRKPGAGDHVSAPMVLTRLRQPFILAEVTVTAEMEVNWDQAGLVIFVGMDPNHSSSSIVRRRPTSTRAQQDTILGKWLKVGLCHADEEIGVASAVAQSTCGPDWSFTAVFPELDPDQPYCFRQTSLRMKLEKVGEDLWVWWKIPESYHSSSYRNGVDLRRDWRKAREVSDFFTGIDVKSGIWVGAYASRPLEMDDGDGKSELFVEFEDLEIL